MKKILLIFMLLVLTGCNNVLEINENQINNKITELIAKNYLYAKYALGEIDYNEGMVSFDDKTYYFLSDEIKSIEELSNLTKEIFVSERWEIYFNIILENKELLFVDNKLYGMEENSSCDIGSNYDFTTFNILKKTKEYIVFTFDDFEYFAYIVNNDFLLVDNIFKCLYEKEMMKNIIK